MVQVIEMKAMLMELQNYRQYRFLIPSVSLLQVHKSVHQDALEMAFTDDRHN